MLCENECVKITLHCKFDELFNDVTTESVPIGSHQYQHLPKVSAKIASGLHFSDGEFYGLFYTDLINLKSSIDKFFNKPTHTKVNNFFLIHIEGDYVFNTKDTKQMLEILY